MRRHMDRADGYDDAIRDELARLRAELNALLESWDYAFAMGHGCSIGDHPRARSTRRRVADLRSRIGELTA